MAPFLAFDCETTGLPKHRRCGYKNLEAFDTCRIVSLAVVEFDTDHNEIGSWPAVVKPVGDMLR